MDKNHEQLGLFDAPGERSKNKGRKMPQEIPWKIKLNYMCLQKIAAEREKLKFGGR